MIVSSSTLKRFRCLCSLNKTFLICDFRCLSTLKEEIGLQKNNKNETLNQNLKKRIFNTVLWEQDPEVSFVKRKYIERKMKTEHTIEMMAKGKPSARPVTLKLLDEYTEPVIDESEVTQIEDRPPTYPYAENVVERNYHQPAKMGIDKNLSHRKTFLTKFAERRKGSKLKNPYPVQRCC